MAAIRRAYARSASRRVWAGIGVSVLAIVVIALSFLALNQNRSVAEAGSIPGISDSSVEVVQAPADAPASASQFESVAVPNRVMAAVDGNSAVRVAATTCPVPSTIEISDDAGATWEPLEVAGVSTVQRITAGSDAFISLIGLAADGCRPAYERSFTGGVAWEAAPDELSASWFVDPANRSVLHAPAGDRPAPCAAVVQLAVIDESSAAVLCDDASVHATIDSGASWLPSETVAGAAAIGVGRDRYLVAVVDRNGCAGAQVVGMGTTDTGLVRGTAGACLSAAVASGDTAIASADDGVTWLWAGDTLARSEDGGETWR